MNKKTFVFTALIAGAIVSFYLVENGFGLNTITFWTLSILIILTIGGLLKKSGLL